MDEENDCMNEVDNSFENVLKEYEVDNYKNVVDDFRNKVDGFKDVIEECKDVVADKENKS